MSVGKINWKEVPVKERKKVFKEHCVNNNLSVVDRNNLFKNIYEGEECVCLTTGPSLSEFPREVIEEYCKDKPVFSIKTAALKYGSITDICLTNYYNFFVDRPKNDFLIFARSEQPSGEKQRVNSRLVYNRTYRRKFEFDVDILWGCDNTGLHKESVCNANRWEENTIDRMPINRLIGPGILNDVGVPVMMHTGVKKINILGWDGAVTTKQGRVYHFYDIEQEYKPTMNYIRQDINLKEELVNDIGIDEQSIVKNAEIDLNNFLKNNGIEIEILTKNSYVNKDIKRNTVLYGE